jgi:hypothetical protein
MIGRALARGVRDATRRPGLVALLWAWNLALAALVTLPFWAWIYRSSSVSPVTDVLLDGADLGVITSLIVADSAALMTLFAGVAALSVLALVSGAFISGGILEIVTGEGDGRPLAHRFFRGAGHFFGRFLRLLLIAVLTGLPALGLVSAALTAATKPLAEGGSEPAAFWGMLIVQGCVVVVAGWLILALDYARAATVLTGSHSMFRTWLRSLAFVVRHLPGAAAIGVLSAIGVAAAFGLTAAYDLGASGRAWSAIVGTILVHQAMLLVRTAVRVGQVSAQADYWKGLQPAVAVAATPAPVVEAPAPQPNVEVSVQAAAGPGEAGGESQ